MDFRQYQEASEFANSAETFLQKDEALNNLPLGILNRCLHNEKQGIITKSAPFFATITDDDNKLVLVLIMTPPFNLGVFGDSSHIQSNEAIEHAIASLKKMPLKVPGVIGTKHLAGTFAEKWCSNDKIIYETAMEQCIFKLTKVNDVPQSPGFIRLATMEDHELLSKWGHEFSFVTETPFTIAEAKEKTKEFIHQESLYVWTDGEPVSMARKARGTSNGMSVNYVYTPKEYENRGYATSCVSELSRMLLKEGYEFCTLYTDLSNPTSNSIYKRIGYRPIGDSIVYQFKSI
ncbi:GNAT family N-acetyltransferase [Alkalihalobacillus sp. TS-13]|uniref:GNAT family N-acetyltransferase n=1 Tax=Alkalihalobacillus sp. TS-13 TaxID=2842455 RepID=UPI001C8712EB|nr:GNAT family N-acetyltransferase [Alkalihalobacillus sp. TS-13]